MAAVRSVDIGLILTVSDHVFDPGWGNVFGTGEFRDNCTDLAHVMLAAARKLSRRRRRRMAASEPARARGECVTRVNRCIELLESGQPIYMDGVPELSYEAGLEQSGTWADYFTVEFEHFRSTWSG